VNRGTTLADRDDRAEDGLMTPLPRAVSLLSSATEITAALGRGDCLVGRSHECDFPDWVASLPACSTSKLNVDAPSGAIDRSVKDLIANALSVYRVDGTKLRELRPDVILTQTRCEVCAVTPRDVAEAVADLTGVSPSIVSLRPSALDDLWRDIRRVGDALDAVDQADRLVSQLQARIAAIEARAAEIEARPAVACIEWIDPLMAAGNWMPELVAKAGGQNLFGEAGSHSPWLDFDALAASDPDIILVMPCGFDLDRTGREMPILDQNETWRALRAVRGRQVYLTDGRQYFNRPGPRLVDSLEILAEILHPTVFSFGHEGGGWVRHTPGEGKAF